MSSAVNDIYRVTAVGSVFGQRIMLTHHYAITTQVTSDTDANVTADILTKLSGLGGDQFETAYLACLPQQYELARWVVQKISPVRVAYKQETRGVNGTHDDACRTGNLTGAMTFRCALAGRSQVSIHKVGPLPEGTGGEVTGLLPAAYKTLLDTLATGMEAFIDLAGPGIRLKACIPHPAPAGSYTLIANHVIGETVNVMRRRTVGRGI